MRGALKLWLLLVLAAPLMFLAESVSSEPTTGPHAGAIGFDRVLYMDDLPGGSGLSVLVSDGAIAANHEGMTDGNGGTKSSPGTYTDNAPAINAAIVYACANDYKTVLLPAGTFRIGDGTTAPYGMVHMDTQDCPSGIRLSGAGIGQTILLPGNRGGGFMITVIDEFVSTTATPLFYGVWERGNITGVPLDNFVTAIDISATPPVLTFDEEPDIKDIEVFIRNCQGITELNEKVFNFANCSGGAPWTCELQDEAGIDVDHTTLSAWTADPDPTSSCSITATNKGMVFELDNFTIMDDAPLAHMQTSGNPLVATSEEMHGIRFRFNGGRAHVHDAENRRMGDEAVDAVGVETVVVIENHICLNSPQGCYAIHSGVGSIIRNNVMAIDSYVDFFDSVTGDATHIPMAAGSAIQLGPTSTNQRLVNPLIEHNLFRGAWVNGITARTYDISTTAGHLGQEIEGLMIRENKFMLDPPAAMCDQPATEPCIAIQLRSDPGAPFRSGRVLNNEIQGRIESTGSTSGLFVWAKNTITPYPRHTAVIAATLDAPGTVFRDNEVTGFTRSCVQFNHATLPDVVDTVDGGAAWDVANEEVAMDSDHPFVSGDRIKITGGAVPTGLSLSTFYWIYQGTTVNDFQFSAVPDNDSAFEIIALSGSGSGTNAFTVVHDRIALEITGNTLECIGNASDGAEPQIDQVGTSDPAPARPNEQEYIKIINNKILLPANGYINRGISVLKNWRGIDISKNTIFAPQLQVGSRDIGIVFNAQPGIVSENTVDGFFTKAGIQLASGVPTIANGGPSGFAQVRNNVINMHNVGDAWGILNLLKPGTQITGNQVKNTGNSGIEVTSNAGVADLGDYNVSGNTLTNVGHTAAGARGIEFNCASCSTTPRVTIHGNIIDMNGATNVDGMRLESIVHGSIMGNVITNLGADNFSEAIYVVEDSDYNICVGNTAEANGGASARFRCASASGDNGLGCPSTNFGVGDNSVCGPNVKQGGGS